MMEKVSEEIRKLTTKQIIDIVDRMPDNTETNKKKLNDIERMLLQLD